MTHEDFIKMINSDPGEWEFCWGNRVEGIEIYFHTPTRKYYVAENSGFFSLTVIPEKRMAVKREVIK